jgi:hypothetical protein
VELVISKKLIATVNNLPGADPGRRNNDGNNSIALAGLAKQNETANYIESFNENTKLYNIF